MKIKAFTLNEIGGRKNVEDAIMPKKFSGKQPSLFIVCDGVGGSSFGEVASAEASKSFYEVFSNGMVNLEKDFLKMLSAALDLFQKRIDDYIKANPSAATTSTTLTMLILKNSKAYVVWCGDSKIFQIRSGKVIFRTKDHSLVAELVAQGVITEKEAEKHPQRNIITRSLSSNTKMSDIEYKILENVQDKDWFLLCTDGLMEQFTENLFPAVLGTYNTGLNYSEAIDKICRGKTKDNYSMYLIHLDQVKSSSLKNVLVFSFIAAALSAGGWFAYASFYKQKNNNPPAGNAISTFRTNVVKKEDSSKAKIDSSKLKKDTDKTKKDSENGNTEDKKKQYSTQDVKATNSKTAIDSSEKKKVLITKTNDSLNKKSKEVKKVE